MYADLPPAEIEHLLKKEVFGNLACCLNGKPYVFPMAYLYHENVIYGQTITGHKTEIVRANPNVCFQVHTVRERGWSSVMCWGAFQELDFADLQQSTDKRIVELLTGRLSDLQHRIGVDVAYVRGDSLEPLRVNGRSSTLFRILIEEKTGKCHDM